MFRTGILGLLVAHDSMLLPQNLYAKCMNMWAFF